MADFTGFYFDNIHSSTYGIIRVSGGDRYTEDLTPDFEDNVIDSVGGEGQLYESTKVKAKDHTIDIAFDDITEEQFHAMKRWLFTTEPKELRYDERPYKAYWAKLKSKPELDFVCFMEERDGEKIRIYKGEGKLEFVSYNPYGYCTNNSYEITPSGALIVEKENWQVTETYVPFTIKDDNIQEWNWDAGLVSVDEYVGLNSFKKEEGFEHPVADLYNPGDLETDFELFIKPGAATIGDTDIQLSLGWYDGRTAVQPDNYKFIFNTKGITKNDTIVLDTRRHALIVYKENSEDSEIPYVKTLRYDLVKSTDWFKIPRGHSFIEIDCDDYSKADFAIKYSYIFY